MSSNQSTREGIIMPRSLAPVTWGAGLAALALAAAAFAQAPDAKPRTNSAPADSRKLAPGRPRGPGGVGGRGVVTTVMLIQSSAVQKELKLTAAQKERILLVNDEFNRRRRESAQALPRGASGVDGTALMAMIASLRAENEEAIGQVLEPRQRRRLSQIAIQAEGPLAAARADVAEAINLGPAEVEYIEGVMRDYKEAADRLWDEHLERLKVARDRALLAPPGPAGAGPASKAKTAGGKPRPPSDATPEPDRVATAEEERFRRESARLDDEAIRQVGRVLTRKQRAAFNRLVGEPFDLATLRPDAPRVTQASALRLGAGGAAALPPEEAPAVLEPIAP
jgi:Spy/CpxP family protein refolding chaperone